MFPFFIEPTLNLAHILISLYIQIKDEMKIWPFFSNDFWTGGKSNTKKGLIVEDLETQPYSFFTCIAKFPKWFWIICVIFFAFPNISYGINFNQCVPTLLILDFHPLSSVWFHCQVWGDSLTPNSGSVGFGMQMSADISLISCTHMLSLFQGWECPAKVLFDSHS